MAPQIEITNLTKAFGGRTAVRRCSASFIPSTMSVLTGPNGSGKTTLLRMIATILSPTSGEIQIDKVPLSEINLSQYRRSIGLALQSSFFYENISLEENLIFFSELYELENTKVTIERWLDNFDLNLVRKARVSTLSKGERQKAILARSLLHKPDILLWDEPLSGLDARSQDIVLEILKDKKRNSTVLVTTHQMTRYGELPDQQIELERGRLLS